MSRQNKDSKVTNFRLILVDDQSHKQLWSKRFTRVNFMATAVAVSVTVLVGLFCLIAFTPIRNLIPGYPDSHARRAAIQNAILADSLANRMRMWEIYAENLKRVVAGEIPIQVDSLMKIARSAASDTRTGNENSDSLLRETVRKEEHYELSGTAKRVLPIEGMHFFTPLKGVISQGYDNALHPYIDIAAPANSVVKAALDGTVISSGWSDDAGYTVQIQHANNIVTIYKHNRKLLKKTGDKVSAGTPIALVGNTGSVSTGEHLHFELWYMGEAVDPADYIKF